MCRFKARHEELKVLAETEPEQAVREMLKAAEVLSQQYDEEIVKIDWEKVVGGKESYTLLWNLKESAMQALFASWQATLAGFPSIGDSADKVFGVIIEMFQSGLAFYKSNAALRKDNIEVVQGEPKKELPDLGLEGFDGLIKGGFMVKGPGRVQ